MSIWGKVLGGVGGFAIGGPIGALLGALGGHVVDKLRQRQRAAPERLEGDFASAQEGVVRSITFTIGVIVLGAKMAKADGQVTRDEVAAFRRVFRIPPGEIKNVARIFNKARAEASGFEPYAAQLAQLFRDQPGVLEEVMWCLAEIARADGAIDPRERDYLRQVAGLFGFDEGAFQRATGVGPGGDRADPYALLGVGPDASDAEVKDAYRQFVREHHPDRLMAQGIPEEFIATANKKMAEVNAAYDQIKKMRAMA